MVWMKCGSLCERTDSNSYCFAPEMHDFMIRIVLMKAWFVSVIVQLLAELQLCLNQLQRRGATFLIGEFNGELAFTGLLKTIASLDS